MLAAEKVLSLDASRAMALLDRALTLSTPADPEYPDVLALWGRAAIQVGRLRDAIAAFREAADHYQQRGDLIAAGAVLRLAAGQLLNLGDPGGREVLDQALRLLDVMPRHVVRSGTACPWMGEGLPVWSGAV
jgi:tetratricopeptide (TPR) repeat protein